MGYVSEPLRTKVYEDAGRTPSCLDLHRRPVTPGTTERTIPRWLEPTVVRPADARIGIDLSQHDGSTYGPGVDVEAIREWFRDKGFGVQVEQDEYAVHWVNLTSLPLAGSSLHGTVAAITLTRRPRAPRNGTKSSSSPDRLAEQNDAGCRWP